MMMNVNNQSFSLAFAICIYSTENMVIIILKLSLMSLLALVHYNVWAQICGS